MKKFFLLVAAIVLQAALFPVLTARGAGFNATLFILALFCFGGVGAAELFSYALFSGIVLDALSGAPFGVLAMTYAATAVFLSAFTRVFQRENTVHFVIFILCATVFFFFASDGMLRIIGSFPARIIPADILAQVVYNTVVGVFFYHMIKKWIISQSDRKKDGP